MRESRFNIVSDDTHDGEFSPVEVAEQQDGNTGLSYAEALEASEKFTDEAI